MRIVTPSIEIVTPLDGDAVVKHIERCGRVCYKSEDRIIDGSAQKFIKAIIGCGHESVLEHFSITVKFIVDRGVSHEIVRHRLASYSQESTRYCNYSKGEFGSEITVVKPPFFDVGDAGYVCWKAACEEAEEAYFALLNIGCTPQEARSVLPNSLKTELYMTANLREWRWFFRKRAAHDAHPQMREVAYPLLAQMSNMIPGVFDDLGDCHDKP